MFEVSAGVTGHGGVGAGFGHASAQRIDYHIHGAEQFYNGEQTNGNIDCYGRAHGCVAVREGDGIAFAGVVMMMAGITTGGRITQICLQSNSLAFRNSEGAAVGIAAAVVQIGGSGHICFCGGILICKTALNIRGRRLNNK